MKSLIAGVSLSLALSGTVEPPQAQSIWTIAQRNTEIQIDGFIEDWSGVSPVRLAPGAARVRARGEFAEGDLEVTFRALADLENLYLAVEWIDNVWDLKQVGRHEAIWMSPGLRRRNRMLFFDNIRFEIREPDYDYTFWFSPRANEEGPFTWHRLLAGLRGIESATSPPQITGRFRNNRVTMEILIPWRELKIEPKKKRMIPLSLLVADADAPGQALEIKLEQAKSLEWIGRLQLPENFSKPNLP